MTANIVLARLLINYKQTLHIVSVPFSIDKKNVHCNTGGISWPISSCNYNGGGKAVAINIYQRYFRKFEILFSLKQQGAIGANRKIYSSLLYQPCMEITIFTVALSLSILSATRHFLAQMKSNYVKNPE